MRPALEVADIFRMHGPAWRAANAGHVSLAQLKVMSAIETCRTAALGGHVEGCEDCGHRRIAYNSCRNRHCPKCQGVAAREWLAARETDLLLVGYFHVVFTVPAEIADIAFHNKAVVYDLLFRVAAETMLIIAADHRLTAFDETGVTFRYKDYRRDAADRQRTMTLSPDEFIHRFLLHVLPKGFHRIRHYGLFASAGRKANLARARELLAVPAPAEVKEAPSPPDPRPPCPCCGGRMVVIEIFGRAARARAPPSSPACTGTPVW